MHERTISVYADWSSAIETVALASLMPITLLIVDDSRTIRLIIRRCVEQADLGIEDIVEADNGEEALMRLSSHNVNLILTGVNMPRMDAVQLRAEMKRSEHWKEIAVLMITTEASSKPMLGARTSRGIGLVVRTGIHRQGAILGPLPDVQASLCCIDSWAQKSFY